jgi:DNA helicase II / ATP-dependent DNA helicase PcrA
MTEIVLGPPGTGKTTHLLGIVDEELTRGVPPDRIAYLSFTRRAANEAIDRAAEKFSQDQRSFPYFRTLHSFCFKQLGIRSSDVFQGRRVKDFGDYIGIPISGRWTEDGTIANFSTGDRMLFMENLARTRLTPLREQYDLFGDDGLYWHDVNRVSVALQYYKQQNHLLDYTDMLTEFLATGRAPKLDVLLVDEGQDLSILQWKVIWHIMKHSKARRLVIAGDDDQAIYRWAGADVDTFLSLEGDVRVLGQSWRVPASIQSISNSIVHTIAHRRPKKWSPRSALGQVNWVPEITETDFAGKSVLVLARNAYLLEQIVEKELQLRGLIYEFRDRSSIKSDVLRAIVAWENLRAGQSIPIEDARVVYEFMSVGEGHVKGYAELLGFPSDALVSIRDLKESGGLLREDVWHEALDRLPIQQMSYLLAARRQGERLKGKPRIKLSTIHAAKGGEADHVIVLQDMATRTYNEMDKWPEDEARVWYVATTRAREQLTIVAPQTKMFYPI